jgi:hypothetical protein
MAGSRRPSLVSHEKKQRMKMPPRLCFHRVRTSDPPPSDAVKERLAADAGGA